MKPSALFSRPNFTSVLLLSSLLVGCSSGPSSMNDAGQRFPSSAQFEFPRDLNQDISSIVQVDGATEQSFISSKSKAPIHESRQQPESNSDVVIVGGGLSGLTSAVFLSDQGKSVVLIEKEPVTGGLAAYGRTDHGSFYSRGAAYWTDASPEQNAIMNHIEMGDYKTKNEIPEPVDGYLRKKQLFLGVWDAPTLKQLPAAFSVFKFELQQADKLGIIPNQPFEGCSKADGECVLDTMTARDWVAGMAKTMKTRVAKWKLGKTKGVTAAQLKDATEILARFDRELAGANPGATADRVHFGPVSNEANGMQDVIEFLDQYGRSALGSTMENISAMGFANFYISEIVPRYTTSYGTGAIAARLLQILNTRQNLVHIMTSSTVTKIHQASADLMQTQYSFVDNDKIEHVQTVQSQYVVFAAQLSQVPYLVDGFTEHAPKAQVAAIKGLQYSHYSVHMVETVGHPFRQAYDTWIAPSKEVPIDFTDVILGRWTDPKVNGYIGIRGFEHDPIDPDGIFTIYDPLPLDQVGKGYSEAQVKESAVRSAKQLYGLLADLPNDTYQGPFRIEKIVSNRWPFAVHVTKPGHFTKLAPLLKQPYGHVIFASNNEGTPAVEEAIFRGHCAANSVLAGMDAGFVPEKWALCSK